MARMPKALEMLTIGAYPDRDGYEIVIVDGSLYTQEEAHRRAVEACEGGTIKEVLDLLCSLYALWHIEQDRGWFQEHGRLSSTVVAHDVA